MKKPTASTGLFICLFISLSREVGMLVMHISANQVPIKDNDTNTFWGTSCKDGRSQSQFPTHSHCQGSPALMPVQFVLQLASASSSLSSLIFSLSPTSHRMLQPHLSISRYINVSSSLCLTAFVWLLLPGAWVFPSYPSRFTQHISKLMTLI